MLDYQIVKYNIYTTLKLFSDTFFYKKPQNNRKLLM